MTEINLAFNPFQPRDRFGRWVHGAGIRQALSDAPVGSTFRETRTKGVGTTADDRIYTKDLSGNFSGKIAATGDSIGTHTLEQVLAKAYPHSSKFFVQTPNDQRIAHDQKMNERDRVRLANQFVKAAKAPTTDTPAKRSIAKTLRDFLNSDKTYSPEDDQYNPFRMGKEGKRFHPGTPTRPVRDLGNPVTGDEIDLDWTEWNRTHGKGGAQAAPVGAHRDSTRRPAAGNQRGKAEIEAFKRSAGLKGTNARLGTKAMEVLRRRASKAGHLRAKAILAAARGNTSRANKIEAARKAMKIAGVR